MPTVHDQLVKLRQLKHHVMDDKVLAILVYGNEADQAGAEEALKRLKTGFFDWNEVRVSLPTELTAKIFPLPNCLDKANSIISLLQENRELL